MRPTAWLRVAAAAALPALAPTAVPAAEPASASPTVVARRLGPDEAIRVDGAFDESPWSRVAWTGSFRQSVPHFGQAATEPTSVAFLFDDHAIYVGVRCEDSAAGLIRANKLRHRDDPTVDDHVEVIFDTYRDQVRGTLFVVNPLGAKEEGLVNGYERYTWDWDEVWDARAKVTAAGWQAEFRIPLRVLRYGVAPRQTWGVNVRRVVRRLQEESYLVPPPPPFDISSLNYEGSLTGLELDTRQRNLQLIPYGLAGTVREPDATGLESRSRTIHEAGLDAKYSVTSDLTLDGTVNTDFAQVEADDEQVNLTRFSLFYPEKREFFLENANLFSFGHFGGNPHAGPDLTPFFSRRIGLYEGRTVPIDAGVRLTGKVGREDVGLLGVRTAAVSELDLAPAWYGVARVRHDLGGRNYVGAIVTDSDRNGFRSTTIGVDGEFYFTTALSLRTDFLRVSDNSSTSATSATNLSLDLTTDPWGFLFSWVEVDQGFDPDLGFVNRDGYRRKEALLRHSFRPEKWGIRRVTLRTNNNWFDSLAHGTLESSVYELLCELELESGGAIEIQSSREYERLFEPFELDPAVSFAAGEYSFLGTDLDYHSDESRRFGFAAELGSGEFYDGRRQQLAGKAWVVASRHLRASGEYSTVEITTGHGSLDWSLWALRLDYTHSANLSASSFLQYNSSTGSTVLNLRLRWILPNDSDLYLVYNDSTEDPSVGPTLRTRELALKLDYRLFL